MLAISGGLPAGGAAPEDMVDHRTARAQGKGPVGVLAALVGVCLLAASPMLLYRSVASITRSQQQVGGLAGVSCIFWGPLCQPAPSVQWQRGAAAMRQRAGHRLGWRRRAPDRRLSSAAATNTSPDAVPSAMRSPQ